jgi:hypothetical protein
MGSGYINPDRNKTIHNYSAIPGFEHTGDTISTPEEVFGRFGGLEAYIRSLEAQSGAQDSSTAAGRTGQDETSERERNLSQPIKAMAIGDPVPVVFARRRTGGTGGVMIQPRATEAQFSNTATDITARYHCLLGEGQIGSIQTKDFRIGLYRRGSYSQNYDKRAGTWAPGNRTKPTAGTTLPDFPQNCGIGGDYKGVTTLEYSGTWPIGSDNWKLACNLFILNGMQIDRGRLIDDVVGPSDNICDLIIWALVKSGRKKESEIDLDVMEDTAAFIEANQLFCNAQFTSAASLPDFLVNILPAFLLRETTTIGGKYAVIPAVPVNADGTIKTTAIGGDAWRLTEEAIAPNSWEERPADAKTRGPLQLSVLWRQQTSDTEPPLDRDLQVGRFSSGLVPQVEELDLRGFATSEQHAALAGGYRHALRTIAGATASVRLLAGSQSGYLQEGQIAQIYLQVVTERETVGEINSLWWIDRVDLAPDGSQSLQLSACPVDAEGRSLVALAVLAARDNAPGAILPYPPLAAGDEPGRASSTTVPPSTTSGVPFTSGGGGIIPAIGRPSGGGGSVNQSDVGVPPVEAPPVAPTPGGPGGGGIAEAGNGPKKPNESKGGGQIWNSYIPGKMEPIDYPPGPGNCEHGPALINTRVTGISFGAGGLSYAIVNKVVETTKRVEWADVGNYFTDYWSPGTSIQIQVKQVTYYLLNGSQITEQISSCGLPPFNEPGEFGLEILSWRCRLADGTQGPLQTA